MGSNADDAGSAVETRGYRITGRVQGVGFRWWARGKAELLGLRGSVWNRRDGSVEVCATGRAEDLDTLEDALGEGPPGARVDSVVRARPDHEPRGQGFSIEH